MTWIERHRARRKAAGYASPGCLVALLRAAGISLALFVVASLVFGTFGPA